MNSVAILVFLAASRKSGSPDFQVYNMPRAGVSRAVRIGAVKMKSIPGILHKRWNSLCFRDPGPVQIKTNITVKRKPGNPLQKNIHSQHDDCSRQVGGTAAAHRDRIEAIAKLLEFLTFPAVAP